jgi:hypothetical protein
MILFLDMTKRYLVAILLGVHLAAGNIFAQDASPVKPFINTEQKVRIEYPDTWFAKEEQTPDIYMLFLSKEQIIKKTDIYKTGISVYKIYNADKNFWYVNRNDPDATIRLHAELYCQGIIKKGQLISRRHEIIKVGGKDAILSEVSFKNDYGEKETLFNIVLFEDNTLVNVIMEAPIDTFENYRALYRGIIDKATVF